VTNIFLNHLRQKFGPIDIERDSLPALQAHIKPLDAAPAESLEQPINLEEVITAIRSGAKHRSPGIDGICHELYSASWETVHLDLLQLLNQMLLSKYITPQQKQGVLVCIPKTGGHDTPNGYGPISLLNSFYKILAQMLARQLRQVMAEQLPHTQFCGVPINSILDAVSQVRDIIAHAENTGTTLCILTLDFNNAFDRIAHDYLFYILQTYGNRQDFIDHLRAIYSDATVSLQVNDTLAHPIPIQCGVR